MSMERVAAQTLNVKKYPNAVADNDAEDGCELVSWPGEEVTVKMGVLDSLLMLDGAEVAVAVEETTAAERISL